MPIDITEKSVFIQIAAACIIFGTVMGFICSSLFYTITHMNILGQEAMIATIPTFWGAVFIIIMAFTGFMIALTARYVPAWGAKFYQTREMPEWFKRLCAYLKEIDERVEE